jgi:hypothetical protein
MTRQYTRPTTRRNRNHHTARPRIRRLLGWHVVEYDADGRVRGGEARFTTFDAHGRQIRTYSTIIAPGGRSEDVL